jgi:DNA-binding protein H-NS
MPLDIVIFGSTTKSAFLAWNPRRRAWPPFPGVNMKLTDFESMSIDELWALHQEIDLVLMRKISAEKNQLDRRLRLLESGTSAKAGQKGRPYPRVLPKYRNPDNPSETWAGRGKQPRWVTAQLRSGKKLDDFRIRPSSDRKGRAPRSRRKSKPALIAA